MDHGEPGHHMSDIVDELDRLALELSDSPARFDGKSTQSLDDVGETLEDGVRSAGLKLIDLLPSDRKHSVAAEIRSLPLQGLALRLPDLAMEVREAVARQKEADDATRSKERFASHVLGQVSREIRDPLLGIIDALRLLSAVDLTFDERESIEMADRSALAMLQLVNDLLDLSRLHSGTFAPEKIDFQLRDCVAAALSGISARAAEIGAGVVEDIDVDVPDDLIGDPGRLRQVLGTLMGNALVAAQDGHVELRVSIKEEDDDALLLHFHILTRSRSGRGRREAVKESGGMQWRGGGATGLGLSISRQIVEQLGGRTWVETRVTGGSALHFTARFGVRMGGVRDGAALDAFELRGLPLLVVDGSTTATRPLIDSLHRMGVRPTVVGGIDQVVSALSAAREAGEPFQHLAICAALGTRRSEALVEAIGALNEDQRPPVVLLTPRGQRGDAGRCRRFGISAYLSLPVDQRDFHDALAVLAGADTSLALSQGVLVTRHFLREARRFAPVLAIANQQDGRDWLLSEIDAMGHRVVALGFDEGARYVVGSLDPPAVVVAYLDDSVEEPHESLRSLSQLSRDSSAAPPALIALVDPTGPVGATLHAGVADVVMDVPLDVDALRQELNRVMRGRIRRPDSAVSRHRTLVDRRVIASRLDDVEMLNELFRVFLAEGDNMTARIRTAIVGGNADDLLRSAHAMRSAVATLGVRSAVDLCARLETCGRRGDVARAMSWLRRLDRVVAAIRVELTATQPSVRLTGTDA